VALVFLVVFMTVVELPALAVLGSWFVVQALYGLTAVAQPVGGGGAVPYVAQLGGFVLGLLAIRLVARRPHADYEGARRMPAYR
jgi:membrane associated rhomboid family serine protease